MRDPVTPAEWQLAVNAAEACLLLGSARSYGLVTGGPVVNQVRCVDILTRGRARRIMPTTEGTDRELHALLGESGATSHVRVSGRKQVAEAR